MIDVNHLVCLGQVETKASGLERKYKNGRATVFLEAGNQLLPGLTRQGSMEKKHFGIQSFLEIRLEQMSELCELGEYQSLIARGEDLFQQLFQPGYLCDRPASSLPSFSAKVG